MNFVLIGDSGHGKVIADCIQAGGHHLIAKLDDKYLSSFQEGPYKKGPISMIKGLLAEDIKVIISIGHNAIRQKIVDRLQLSIEYYGTVIHPSAIISPTAKIGYGTVIMPNVVINADSVIENHVILNTGCVIEHDCTIQNFAHISPGAVLTGGVLVQEGTQIGARSSVNPTMQIGKWSMIGAGSAVINDIPDNVTAVGVPAKIIKERRSLND
ncbi:acetyltransferase [Metasolibacillus sp.]|uniref:acetyltransferase n=1 Tax=Metasolibacillus sp. TaxID=2703680 RepID=UPI0025D13926|nr:acetyltransferase [Metasolibacillus sp.]MCT6923376.1 acetyltransferase [Metasolibacillus sp.]MCT6939901.1 acetyltransferase [Metasolibacillus sp.]